MAEPILSEAGADIRVKDKKKSKKSKSKTDDVTAKEAPAAETYDENTPTKKRKREILPEEIVVDVNLPEPASKKALRKAKKAKTNPEATESAADGTTAEQTTTKAADGETKGEKRSQYGVWIGNLPWSATKATLRSFLTEHSDITDDQITRVHMPPPSKSTNAMGDFKPLNKGFAYVDFSTELAMYSAIALTETKMDGRRPLLIKNANNFEGRPKKAAGEADGKDGNVAGAINGKPPNKRVFIGNLAFDVTKEDLEEHFGQCGEIALTHMATFEDSGKCKGYAWITFEDIEAATTAVRGYIFKQDEDDKDEESGDEDKPAKENKKQKKGRKWFINRLRGRDLRCEFAEDSTVRYNKRYGPKDKAENEKTEDPNYRPFNKHSQPPAKPQERRKVDARTIRPGAAHTSAPRASQAIVASQGKKMTFDD
ncbi:hypothetical protein GQ43DRAFT_440239 [Delitschia confertaspora ATCC 74209]|uniref:RRM domain-containing protein n=1 Tax=Delitschia confertaspora ATCC 74209 TaxID=1513339 RepID=A0A9P4JLQ0_9PLEO|nr:hypothetical protein GQ43DRAFT_440239 [Delitschia confertaspora ATCC 74209]